MPIIYNIEFAKEDWIFKQGDTINLSRPVLKNGTPYIMTGMRMDIYVRRLDGLLIRTFTSFGGSPQITLLLDVFTLYATGFVEVGTFKADIQIIDLANDVLTIGDVNIIVVKQYTT